MKDINTPFPQQKSAEILRAEAELKKLQEDHSEMEKQAERERIMREIKQLKLEELMKEVHELKLKQLQVNFFPIFIDNLLSQLKTKISLF